MFSRIVSLSSWWRSAGMSAASWRSRGPHDPEDLFGARKRHPFGEFATSVGHDVGGRLGERHRGVIAGEGAVDVTDPADRRRWSWAAAR